MEVDYLLQSGTIKIIFFMTNMDNLGKGLQ